MRHEDGLCPCDFLSSFRRARRVCMRTTLKGPLAAFVAYLLLLAATYGGAIEGATDGDPFAVDGGPWALGQWLGDAFDGAVDRLCRCGCAHCSVPPTVSSSMRSVGKPTPTGTL